IMHILTVIPLPQRFTLFPYTTLFRSNGGYPQEGTTGFTLNVTGVTPQPEATVISMYPQVSTKRLRPFPLSANDVRIQKFSHVIRSEEHTSELQSQSNLVCRLLLEKKK